eukprot:gnl/MRDRNA2_/MRDRNA2_104660_c0_seq1.p1 gnl/MRDRNA2_/MRDRNA2_104660_c0~~gnl/MRDRNA2_/MRDRNA2_104660_c0_seq1.p1  ORF type:complete len:617 (+),score=128.61 gnl/MRDRNA2_/MRDRNA2_104660_c0_seq1:181-2031(+)
MVDEAQPEAKKDNVAVHWAPKEKEIFFAEMENRLRDQIIRILAPSMNQYATLFGKMDALKFELDSHKEMFGLVNNLRVTVENVKEQTAIFRDELGRISADKLAMEQHLAVKEIETKAALQALNHAMQTNSSDMHNLNKEIQRLWEESTRLQRGIDSSHSKNGNRIDDLKDETMKWFQDLQGKDMELDVSLQYLNLELFSEDKGLRRIDQEISSIKKQISIVPALPQDIDELRKRVSSLDEFVDGTKKIVTKTHSDMDALAASTSKDIHDLRQKCEELTNSVAARHAIMVRELRKGYEDELHKVRAVRTETHDFMQQTINRIQVIEGDLKGATKEWETLHQEIRADLEDVNKKRKRDKLSIELEVREFKKATFVKLDQQPAMWSGLEHLAGVFSVLLEAVKVESALAVQDFLDNKSRTWLDADVDPKGGSKQEKLPAGIQGLMKCVAIKQEQDPPESIDVRKSNLIRQRYSSGSVKYGDATYDRADLLSIQHRLLTKANDALQRGPEKVRTEYPEETSVSHIVLPARTLPADFPEPRKSSRGTRSSSGRRPAPRPGSVGQPEAVGSRGTGGVGGLELPTIHDEDVDGKKASEVTPRSVTGPQESEVARLPALPNTAR